MSHLISSIKSIIPSCDVSNVQRLEHIVKQTCDIYGVGGYKIGFELTIQFGLKSIVDVIRKYTNLPIIYDHQKGGTDIPRMGSKFAGACRASGVESVILFPFGGLATEEEWIKSCQDAGLIVIVGGHMTHNNFLQSEEGFIADDSPKRIYEAAIKFGVTDFVVPGNRLDLVAQYRKLIESSQIPFVLYAPGFITQGGMIAEFSKAAGDRWHAIVGASIYEAVDIKDTVREMTKELGRSQ